MTVPAGFREEWVKAPDRWRVISRFEKDEGRTCSHPRCQRLAVAVLNRSVAGYWDGHHRTRRCFCCDDHLYGRRVSITGPVILERRLVAIEPIGEEPGRVA